MHRAIGLLSVAGLLVAVHSPLRSGDAPPGSELGRRVLFGAQLAPVTKEVEQRQRLGKESGVVLEKVLPDTSAADAGFQAGDVIVAMDGAEITEISVFLERLARARAGEAVTLGLVRDGAREERKVTLRPMPLEKGEGYDVIYGAVTSRGARLRVIITRPLPPGRHPAVMLLQGGHTCFPIDDPFGNPTAFTRIAQDLARHGHVTMRVERPGCGDSEGGPLRDVDFEAELDGYGHALRALKELEYVDPENVFLFGHSMGGIMAPLLGLDTPVRGIAVYGTTAETWFESVVGQRRRLTSLDGTDPADVDREILDQARFWYGLSVERKSPAEIRAEHPELPERVREQWVTDGVYVAGRHYTFYHQIAGRNLARAWTEIVASKGLGATSSRGSGRPVHPRVLAIWGTSDWLATREQAAWIAEVVNRARPGSGTFIALESIDHHFFRARTPEESHGLFKSGKPGEFHPVIVETLRAWLDGMVRGTPGTPGRAEH